MTRIYLTGHRTFSNRGCEAIVRSTVAVLRAAHSDIEVLVPSDDVSHDTAQWPEAGDNGVRFVPAYTPRLTRYWVHMQRLPVPLLKRAGWPFPFPRWLQEQMASVDAVLSVGGDNYSLDYRLPSLLQGMDGLALDMAKPVAVWGASVGPFEREPHFVPAIREHLARIHHVYVRESISEQYLTSDLRLRNVSRMPDPAFTLQPQSTDCSGFWPRDDGNGVIGLNVSPLIERYKRDGQHLVGEVAAFVRETVEKTGHGLLLVPHVIPAEGSARKNDALYMSQILSACPDLGDRVRMIPTQLNAAQIKHVISQLRFFIGARTHATIAAMSSGVPTISIAYSVKARGINKDLFGNEDVVLPTPEVSAQSLKEKRDYLVANEDMLRQVLANRVPSYQARVFEAAQSVSELTRG